MHKLSIVVLGIIILVAAGAIFLFQGDKPARDTEDKVKVAATIYPLYDIVRQVAGNEADTKLVLSPGASPHTFEFTPRQLQELQGTRAVFAIGHGIDDWIQAVENAVPGVEASIVDTGIRLRATVEPFHDEEEGGEEEEHGPIDPHYWLNFENARQIADNVAETFAELDESNRAVYEENAGRYKEQLSQTERDLQARLSALRNRNIVTLHDAWFYFADNFGLNVVGTFEPSAGEEPTPQFLAELRRVIQQNNVKILFGESQLGISSLQNFADDNNLALAELDPLGGTAGRDTFIDLMRYNVGVIAQALTQ